MKPLRFSVPKNHMGDCGAVCYCFYENFRPLSPFARHSLELVEMATAGDSCILVLNLYIPKNQVICFWSRCCWFYSGF